MTFFLFFCQVFCVELELSTLIMQVKNRIKQTDLQLKRNLNYFFP